MADPNKSPLRIGLVGYGTVGSGLARILKENRHITLARTGREIHIVAVMVRDATKKRTVPYPEGALVTASQDEFFATPGMEVVVEVMGGVTTAKTIIEKAISLGKHVVTANKALLAETGNHLFALAAEKNVSIGYEASVCGGIPIVETLKYGLAANDISSLVGILNGTSNYILSEMTTKGYAFDATLKTAQDKGYAEADPTFDIEGIDAAHKLCLLIRLAWGLEFPFDKMTVKGISSVQPADIEFARTFGYRVKLIAQAKMHEHGLEAAVFPAFVHETYLLSRVGGAYNAVRIHGNAVGSVFLHGKGAGDMPTGSAVAADIFDIARGDKINNTGFVAPVLPVPATLLPKEKMTSPFYIRLQMTDQPGVLRDVASIMAENNISIAQAIQKKGLTPHETPNAESVPFTIMTHEAAICDVEKAVNALAASPSVHEAPVVYRVLARQSL